MPIVYNKISRKEIVAVAEALLLSGEKVTQVVQLMIAEGMEEAYLPWSDATIRAVHAVVALGTQCRAEVEEQVFAKNRGIPSRHEKTKERSEYHAKWRKAKSAKKEGKDDA